MYSNLSRLWLCNTSALITGAVLPCAALAHPVFARTPDSRALTKLAQLAARKSSIYLLVGHSPTASTVATSLSIQGSIVASSSYTTQLKQLQSQILAANQRIASAHSKSSKSAISLFHPRSRTLLNQLQLIRRTERRTSIQAALEAAK